MVDGKSVLQVLYSVVPPARNKNGLPSALHMQGPNLGTGVRHLSLQQPGGLISLWQYLSAVGLGLM